MTRKIVGNTASKEIGDEEASNQLKLDVSSPHFGTFPELR
jgi:hypothetical protein